MPSEWAEVDTLIRELGVVRSAFDETRASETAKAGIAKAIGAAAHAVVDTVNAPRDGEAILQARQAIATARGLVAALAAEMERACRANERAAELGVTRPRRGDGESS